MPSEELDVPTNFRSQEWEQARDTLDNVFHRIFDLLKANPALHALVDGRESEPEHKAGDFAVDYRDGNIKLKMSDGKNLLEIGLSALGGTISAAQHGAQSFEVAPGSGTLMHPLATGATAGFMSGTEKTKLAGLVDVNPANSDPIVVSAAAPAPGASTLYSRADHVHQALVGAPVSVGSANSAGSGNALARANHVHDHGNQTDGAMHALAAGAVNGFCTGADRTKLNQFDGYTAGGSAPTPAVGHYAFWYDGSSNTYLYFTGGAGTKRVQLI